MKATPRCRACGMPIEFLKSPAGKLLPAQAIRTVYEKQSGDDDRLMSLSNPESGTFYISHFETCPSAGEFSKK